MKIDSKNKLESFLNSLESQIDTVNGNQKEKLIKDLVKQTGGVAFILPSEDPILSKPYKGTDQHAEDYWEGLFEPHRSVEAIFLNIENVSNTGLWEIPNRHLDSLKDIVSTFKTRALFTKKEGRPGLYFFGEILGKTALLNNILNPKDISPLVLSGDNLLSEYRNTRDHATRYVFEKYNIDILFQEENSNSYRSLPQVRSLIKGGRKSASIGTPTIDEDFTGNIEHEDNQLKYYFENRNDYGVLFTEFDVTTMIENSNSDRRLDGLYLRTPDNEKATNSAIFESSGSYRHIKSLINKQYPCQAIEVHKWGWEGFGQVVGKAFLLETFWDPSYVRKIFVVKNKQGNSEERLDIDHPQPDMESIMNDFGVEIVIPPEST